MACFAPGSYGQRDDRQAQTCKDGKDGWKSRWGGVWGAKLFPRDPVNKAGEIADVNSPVRIFPERGDEIDAPVFGLEFAGVVFEIRCPAILEDEGPDTRVLVIAEDVAASEAF